MRENEEKRERETKRNIFRALFRFRNHIGEKLGNDSKEVLNRNLSIKCAHGLLFICKRFPISLFDTIRVVDPKTFDFIMLLCVCVSFF